MTRQIADLMAKALGHPVIVDAKPGAGGSMALQQAVRANPDGHTLVLMASGTMAVNPYLYDLKYKPVEDLAPITILVDIPFVVVTRPDFPARTLKEFIAHAKANPEKISFANAGVGTQAHLTQMMFMKEAGISANVVPYKGGTGAIADLLGGHIDAMIDNAAAQVANVQAGKVRALFVTTRERSESLPGVPTAQEAGLPGFVTSGWFGLAAPKGTPQAVIAQLEAAIQKTMQDPAVRKKLEQLEVQPVFMNSRETQKWLEEDVSRYGAVIREAGLEVK